MTTLNLNKGNSGRSRTGRSEDNIEAVRRHLAEHPTGTSARRNGIGLPPATFNRITRLHLHMHPYHMHIRHQLLHGDYVRWLQFVPWLDDRYERNEDFLRSFVTGDEAAVAMDGQVNSYNVRQYAAAEQPPEFNYEVNISREKLMVGLDFVAVSKKLAHFSLKEMLPDKCTSK